MESFFEYYDRLFNDIPYEYSQFGNFGEVHWHLLINEGLITSYPKNKVIDFLVSLGGKDVSKNELDSIDMLFTVKNFKIFKKDLNDKLKVYGYFISKDIQQDSPNTHKLLIEPIKPSELKIDTSKGKFYHITYKDYLEDIEQIGLVPKDSRTVFTHPGNRIYMIQTKDFVLLDQLKYMLSDSRKKSLEGQNYPQHLIDEMTPENMAVLEINVDGLKLYNDPMFPSYMKTFFACFTTQNIHPNRITLTNH